MSKLSDDIDQAFNAAGQSAQPSLSLSKVRGWMVSEDIEALGILGRLISSPEYFSCIQPAIPFEEYKNFFLRYYSRCFIENPDLEEADGRYEAGYDLMAWFTWMWSNPEIPRAALAEIKDWLASLYRNGDENLRRAIVDATLEHLFENDDIAVYFQSWKDDPILKQAHAEASDWVAGLKEHGIQFPTR